MAYDGTGAIEDLVGAAVKAASDVVDRNTASVFWKTEAECGWQNVVSGEDHINVVINSSSALAVLHKDHPAKKVKFGQSSSSLEVIQAPLTPDVFELQSALTIEADLAPPLVHALEKPAVHALCCPALEQLILQKLPLNMVCMQHVQKFLRKVHPTALMIKQLSFSRICDGRIAELVAPHLIVSGTILGNCKWKCGKRVLHYHEHNKRFFFIKKMATFFRVTTIDC